MRHRGDQADCGTVDDARAARSSDRGLARPRPIDFDDWRSPLYHAQRALGTHFALTFNAGALAAATMANGAFGFVYWWVAARSFTPAAVGLASADISLMMLLSLAADFGLGTLLQGEIPRRRRLAPHLVSAALLASLAIACLLGIAYVVLAALAATFAPSIGDVAGFSSTRCILVIGVGVQTASSVLDSALVGMLSAPLRLLRNLLFAVAKLLFIIGIAAAVVPEGWQLDLIIASWVIGQGGASLALAGMLWLGGSRIWYRPRFDLLWQRMGVALWYYALNVMATAPTLILPVVIASVVSAEQTAPFYAAWMLLTLAGVVPAALATVLFTVGAEGRSETAASIRFSLAISIAIGVIAAFGFWLLSDTALKILNPAYSNLVGSDLRFLGASVPLMAVKVHYMTVQRLENRARSAAFMLGALGAIEILFATIGAELYGLLGATTGWLLAMALEAACLWPTIWRRVRDEKFGAWSFARAAFGRLKTPSATAGERPVEVIDVQDAASPSFLSAQSKPTASGKRIAPFVDTKQARVLR